MSTAKTILLVDDQQRFLAVLANELRDCSSNFCVLTAENGEEALKILESAKVDVVITDLKMPVMNGFELLSHMNKKYPNIPAFVVSSFLHPEVKESLEACGVLQCIAKESLDLGALEETIIKTLPIIEERRSESGSICAENP